MENNATASNNISSAIVENLTKVLSEELCQHMRHGGTEHKRLQKRIEAILCRFLEHQPAGHETLNFGNQILDLLLANYDWNEEKFEHEMEISEIETIIGEIRQLQREIAVEQQFNRQCPRQPTIQPDSSPDQTSLSIGKKFYADILIDRPFNIVETNRSGMEQENYLMNCLRYRLSYPDLNYNAAGGPNRGSNDKKISVMKTTVPEEPLAGSISLYDTLLRLIDEFDAAGVVEIFRLLKERRSAIPLFVPTSKKHHLHLMKHVLFNSLEEVLMGQGEKLTRVAVVSCYTDKSESLTNELLKSLFHIDSVHFHDFDGGHITSENVTAEIGCGCLLTGEKSGQEKNIQHMMVVHVVGDFRPLWPFLAKFADYVLVEDGTEEKENFLAFLDKNPSILRDIIHASSEIKEGQVPFVSVWKSSRTQTNGIVELYDRDFRYYSIGNTSGSLLKSIKYLRSAFSSAVQQSQSKSTRLPLHEISHTLEDAGYSPLMYTTPVDVQSAIANEDDTLSQVKREQFLLQKLYEEQAKHEENCRCDRRLEKSRKKAEAKIRRCQQKRRIRVLQTDLSSSSGPKLLQLLLELLMNPDPCSRALSLRILEKKLTERNKYKQRSQLENIDKLERAYCEKATERNEAQDKDLLMKLNAARIELDEGVFGIEHLWRELSHYYTAVKSEHRSSLNAKIPQLAAQHLLDGFSMEFLDGDSNRLHLDWVTQVLRELEKLIGKQKRIFVLSVMGVQSSGKSTLLNTMFGIQMRTGIGQSTRGVNMQLLKVEDRAEYDYILLLDTEGCRAPEFQGLPAGRKRDNQMATLSVLLADATIVAINGVDVSAIREILPIVLIAYQGSRLADHNDGRRSSRMFFVFNRINTKDDDKLHSIIINFKMSLAEAFRQLSSGVTSVAGSRTESLNLQGTTQTPFTNFKMTVTNFKNSSSESDNSDFCILGNVQKGIVPPNDVPDPEFGKSLVGFRERIHRRVVGVSENGLATWRGRSMDEFCQYVELVWKCICSADLTVMFASVIECITLDKLDYEYKMIEQDLTVAYRKVYDTLKNEMIGRSPQIGSTGGDDARLKVYKNQLKARIALDIHFLSGRVAVLVKGEGRDKWKDDYGKMWKACKEDQAINWGSNLQMAFVTIFNYEKQVETYKKMMRRKFNEIFPSPPAYQKHSKLFEDIYQGILKLAEEDFPRTKISEVIDRVYAASHVILRLDSNDLTQNYETKRKLCLQYIRIANDKRFHYDVGVPMSEKSYLERVTDMVNKATLAENHQINPSVTVIAAFESVYEAVNNIVAGEVFYHDSIVFNVILKTDEIIGEKNIVEASEVHLVHFFGKTLIVQLMETIQGEWEDKNSVSGKLKQSVNKKELHNYFDLISRGYKKTQLFAAHMANILKANIIEDFEEDIVMGMLCHPTDGIQNERWLHDTRTMQHHIDLYLVDLLDENKLDRVLDYVRKPQKLYQKVLCRLIVSKVPNVRPKWNEFVENVKLSIETAIASIAFFTSVDRGRVEQFVNKLKMSLLSNVNLRSKCLAQAFSSSTSFDEFRDSDNEEMEEFQEACRRELTNVFQQLKPPPYQKDFAETLCQKVINIMKMNKFKSVLPRCSACCRMCSSMCIKPMGHTSDKDSKHDTIHQPGGIAGISYNQSRKLCASSCSQSYKLDETFYMDRNYTVSYKFRNFSTVFPQWENPRLHEDWPLREYILKTYNQQIAHKYEKKPCDELFPHRCLSLTTIRSDLEAAIAP